MPSVFGGTVFETFPFALPSMVITVNCLIMFAVAYVWLSETLVLKTVYPSDGGVAGGGGRSTRREGLQYSALRSSDEDATADSPKEDPSPRSEGSQKVYSPLMAEEDHSSASRESLLPRVRYSNGAEFFESMDSSQKSLATNLAYLMRQKQIVVSTTLYGFSSFVVVIGNEIFTLWVVTSRADGGLSYNTQQIGVAVMICGVIGTLLQLTLFPYASDRLGTLGVHRYGGLMFAANSLFIPCIPYISSNTTITMIIVVLALTMQSVAATWYLISTFVLISNSCYSHQLATVNGIGQTCASLGRLSGPYLGSVLFAWSETNGMEWPFNQYLVYYLLALLCLLIYQYSFLLPKSIQRRKREPKFRNWDDADAHYRREQEREQTLAQERIQGQEQKQGEQQLSQLTQTKGNSTDSGAPQSDIDSAFKTGNSELIVREPEVLNGKEEKALK
eukprot:gene11350-13201_t